MIDSKINELCTVRAETFKDSERLYKHKYEYCTKELLDKNLSLDKINDMIISEDSAEVKKKKIEQRINNSQKLLAQKEPNIQQKCKSSYSKSIEYSNKAEKFMLAGQRNSAKINAELFQEHHISAKIECNNYKNYAKGLNLGDRLEELYMEEGLLTNIPNKKKKINKSYTSFNVDENDCYMIGVAYGVCATRSQHGIVCEKGTDFVMPQRCRNITTTKEGIESGVAMQTLLMNQ